jgi:uncharacterized protein (UPF0335 family)
MKIEQLIERIQRLENNVKILNDNINELKKLSETNQTDILALSQSTTEKLDKQTKNIDEVQYQLVKFFLEIQNSAILHYLFRNFDSICHDEEHSNE